MNGKNTQNIRSVIFVLGALVALSSFSSQAYADSDLPSLRAKGYASAAIGNEPPWTQVDGSGKASGAGPEILQHVLQKLGVAEVRPSVLEYGAMIPALQAGRVDLLSGGTLFPNPSRCSAILFSEPDICEVEGFAVAAGNPAKITSYADVAKQGLRIVVCGGCVEEKFARDAGVASDKIVIMSDGPSGMKMLQDGRVDVFALPASSVASLLAKADDSRFERILVADTPVSCSAVGFRKDQAEFRDAFDKELLEFRKSDTYKQILAKYGFPDKAMDTTRAELCGGAN